ncbi:MAG: type II and III secretion system protein, partial [Candidatus Omnitrophica bacterium]|nr:type II and III secretion system protein [Candidatus Omnitrophota bacterium]
VRVLSVVFNPTSDFGIDWSLAFNDNPILGLRKLQFKNISLDESNLTSSDNLFSKYGRIATGAFGVDEFAAALRAMKSVSDTKILANPKLLVTNQEEAKIHVGDTVPYIVSTTSGTGDNAITSEDVRFVDVGLKLSVTPTINDDGFVTMSLKPEISTVTKNITSQGGGIPQITKTEVETNVIVKDGVTIVLGGLKQEQKVLTRRGVPGLMDVPVLGNFFGNRSEEIESSETVIFITPHIVSGVENHPERRGATIKPSKDYKEQQPEAGIKP